MLAAALRSQRWETRPSSAHGRTVSISLPESGRLDVELVLEDGAPRIESIIPNGIEVAGPE